MTATREPAARILLVAWRDAALTDDASRLGELVDATNRLLAGPAATALRVEDVMAILDATANAGWDATSTYEAKHRRAAAVLARLNEVLG